MNGPSSDVAFTPSVKAAQTRLGSREAYAQQEANGGFRTEITPDLVAFLAGIDTAFLATASAAGQPYAQYRGGPPGFIRPLGANLLGFADYAGNRQYITTGNLAENDRAFLFLIDYSRPRRVKLWGHARMSDDAALIARLMPDNYKARPERALLFEVAAWDINCPQHIPRKINLAEAHSMLSARDARIKDLETQLAEVRGRSTANSPTDGANT
jgi:predicted pyridoxine 5'-phosphate oxidase superfamily flavin-nucleotide-binding protein